MLFQTLVALALVAVPLTQASDRISDESKSLNSDNLQVADLDPGKTLPSTELKDGCHDEPKHVLIEVPAPEDAVGGKEKVPAWCCDQAKGVNAGACQEDLKLHPYWNEAMPPNVTLVKSMFRVCATEPVAGKYDFENGHLWGWSCTDDHDRPAYWRDDKLNPEDTSAGTKVKFGAGVLWIAVLSAMLLPSLVFGASAAGPAPVERHPGEPHEDPTMLPSTALLKRKGVSAIGIEDCDHQTIKWSDTQGKTCCDLWATEESNAEEACWTIDEWVDAMEDWVNTRSTNDQMIKDESDDKDVATPTIPEEFAEVTSGLCQQHGNGKPVCKPLETFVVHHGEIVPTPTFDAAQPSETSGGSSNIAELSLGFIAAVVTSLGLAL